MLIQAIANKAAELAGVSQFPAITRSRYRWEIEKAIIHINNSISLKDAELNSEEIRLAARCMENSTGKISTDEILDSIFSNFCIGK